MKHLLRLALLATVLLLSVPAQARDFVKLGQDVNQEVQETVQRRLANDATYKNARPEQQRVIHAEALRETMLQAMDQRMNGLQRKITQQIQGVVNRVLVKALPDTDKRIPEIKRLFLAEMYKQMNHGEDSNAFYNLYDSASGNGLGASIETIINNAMTAQKTLTLVDIELIIRALSPPPDADAQ